MKIFSIFFLGLTLFSIGYTLVLADFSSASFTLENPINFIGGGESSSSSFQYISTTGQITQGQSTSASFAQNAGFLYFPEVVVPPPVPPPPVPPPGGGGGGGVYIPGLEIITCSRVADFNCDGHVSIFDLSILLYYMEHTSPIITTYDLSGDGKIDLTDISILFYYWDEV